MKCLICGAQIEEGSAFCTVCGSAVASGEEATVAAGFERTVASPELQNSGAVPPAQYGYPQQPAPVAKKKSVMPVVIAILAVLVVVLAGALIFKEDIVALFEKDTASSRSGKNKKDDDKYGYEDENGDDGENDYADYPYEVETTIDQAALDKELEDALKNTQAPVTKIQEVVVTEVITRKEERTEVVTEVVTEAPMGITTQDAAVIADYYNDAVAATIVENSAGEAYLVPKGQQTMVLSKNIDGDGAIGTVLKVIEPAIDSALAKNSMETKYIPGGKRGELQAGDIVKATAISKNGKTEITITLKQQVDGPDCDGNTAGPVARGIGTLGNIDSALAELGAEITSGRDTIKLTYKNAYIKCVVDEATGRIISGEWFYTVDIFIGEAQMKLGIPANLKNLTTAIDYKVVI